MEIPGSKVISIQMALNASTSYSNKRQSNLAKGDIVLLIYSRGGSTRHVVCPGGCNWNSHFGEGEVVGVSERATLASYRLSIVTIALSLTIRP